MDGGETIGESVREDQIRELYLGLLKRVLTRSGFGQPTHPARAQGRVRRTVYELGRVLARWFGWELVDPKDTLARVEGRDWPLHAETMIGLERLDHLQDRVTDVLRRKVPGDLLEAGTWRGGAAIFMRAVLEAYGDPQRTVWVADSFRGLPRPSLRQLRGDVGDLYWSFDRLAVSLDEVRENFARYGLLDERVRFIEGWFEDTLPRAPIERLAVLRVDADMYDSTLQALRFLYPRLSIGGYVIVDDYGAVPACRKAVDRFRKDLGITTRIETVDWTAICWRRE